MEAKLLERAVVALERIATALEGMQGKHGAKNSQAKITAITTAHYKVPEKPEDICVPGFDKRRPVKDETGPRAFGGQAVEARKERGESGEDQQGRVYAKDVRSGTGRQFRIKRVELTRSLKTR